MGWLDGLGVVLPKVHGCSVDIHHLSVPKGLGGWAGHLCVSIVPIACSDVALVC